MPTISMFYGIIIYMYYFDNKEHNTPHIHANYAENDEVISIPEGNILKGKMPNNKPKRALPTTQVLFIRRLHRLTQNICAICEICG